MTIPKTAGALERFSLSAASASLTLNNLTADRSGSYSVSIGNAREVVTAATALSNGPAIVFTIHVSPGVKTASFGEKTVCPPGLVRLHLGRTLVEWLGVWQHSTANLQERQTAADGDSPVCPDYARGQGARGPAWSKR